MIIGQITEDREAVVQIRLRGSDSLEVEVKAIVDTGFTDFLTLPEYLMTELSFPRLDTMRIRLAVGQAPSNFLPLEQS